MQQQFTATISAPKSTCPYPSSRGVTAHTHEESITPAKRKAAGEGLKLRLEHLADLLGRDAELTHPSSPVIIPPSPQSSSTASSPTSSVYSSSSASSIFSERDVKSPIPQLDYTANPRRISSTARLFCNIGKSLGSHTSDFSRNNQNKPIDNFNNPRGQTT